MSLDSMPLSKPEVLDHEQNFPRRSTILMVRQFARVCINIDPCKKNPAIMN